MIVWGLVLFGLAILALLDSIYNYGQLFRSVSPALFMLTSLGLLLRANMLSKQGDKEKLLEANKELKAQLERLIPSKTSLEKKESKQDVSV